jgi:hypothetical protein
MAMQPLTVLTVMHCHGNKDVVGVAHAHLTAVVTTPGERRALLVAEAAAIYYLVVPTIVNRHRGFDVLDVNQKHAGDVSTTLPWQLYTAPDRTTHSVEPTDISPLALNTVNLPVHATTPSVEPRDISPIAYDTVDVRPQ